MIAAFGLLDQRGVLDCGGVRQKLQLLPVWVNNGNGAGAVARGGKHEADCKAEQTDDDGECHECC